MVDIQCDICQDSFSLDKFRFFHCGHGFCEICLAKTHLQRTCALCRQPKGNHEPRQVYMTFTAAVGDAADALEVDERIEIDSLATSVQRTICKLKGKAKQVADEHGTNGLLEVASKLDQRMTAFLSELEREKTTKSALEKERNILERKLTEAQQTETEVVRLRRKLREAHANYKSAASLAEEALDRIQGGEDENSRLNQVVERHRRAIEKKDAEIHDLRAAVDQKEKEARLWKQKLHVMARQGKRAKRASQDPDESLQIERPTDDTKERILLEMRKKRRKRSES